MEIARDISEYNEPECRAVYNGNGKKLTLRNHWIRWGGTNHTHAEELTIDGESFEVYVRYPNMGGHIREERKNFKETGFDVVADLYRLWIIFPDFITIVCESSLLGGKRSEEDQIDFANICKFIKGANLCNGLMPEKDRVLGINQFVEEDEIEDFDASDVKKELFNVDGSGRIIKIDAKKIFCYRNSCKEVSIDSLGEISIYYEIGAPPVAWKEPEKCRIQVQHGEWKRDYAKSKYWVDYSDETRVLIGDSERKAEGILLVFDEANIDKVRELKRFLYACVHYDLYRDNVRKKSTNTYSARHKTVQEPYEISSQIDDDAKQEKIVDYLKKYNDRLINSQRLKALLSDCIPEDKLIIHVMQIAYEEKICEELKSEKDINIIKGKYIKILCNNYGISAWNAEWAVDTWARVFENRSEKGTQRTGFSSSDPLGLDDLW